MYDHDLEQERIYHPENFTDAWDICAVCKKEFSAEGAIPLDEDWNEVVCSTRCENDYIEAMTDTEVTPFDLEVENGSY